MSFEAFHYQNRTRPVSACLKDYSQRPPAPSCLLVGGWLRASSLGLPRNSITAPDVSKERKTTPQAPFRLFSGRESTVRARGKGGRQACEHGKCDVSPVWVSRL